MIIVKNAHDADLQIIAGECGGFVISGDVRGSDIHIRVDNARQVKRFLARTESLCGSLAVFDMTERVYP